MNIPPAVAKRGKIFKAAIRMPDEIYLGWRHHLIRDYIVETGKYTRLEIVKAMGDEWNQGFITETGQYMSRKQALCQARRMGQVNELIGSILTSEDLWDIDGHPLVDKNVIDNPED
jgi:hypothetical protein